MPPRSRILRACTIAADLTTASTMAGLAAWQSRFWPSHLTMPRAGAGLEGLRAQFLIEADPRHGLAPAARYRVQQYVPLLEEMGIECDVRPSRPGKYFSASAGFQRSYERLPKPTIAYAHAQHLRQLLNRLRDFRRSRRAHVVLLQRDLLALPHSRLEDRLPAYNRHIVFDFDDAIFESPSWSSAPGQDAVDALVRQKIARICSLSSVVIAANDYLAEFASEHCARVEVVPTCLCTVEFHPSVEPRVNEVKVIGWIGTSGNLHYLRAIAPALRELAKRHAFVLRIICNRVKPAELPDLPPDHLEFVEWSAVGEVERIQDLDIGIMPLLDDAWTRGKAGFKLIQYMACGVPVVYSPVGANPSVVGLPGDCGLPASTDAEWVEALETLLSNPARRQELGSRGRARAISRFDRRIHAPTIAAILSEAADA